MIIEQVKQEIEKARGLRAANKFQDALSHYAAAISLMETLSREQSDPELRQTIRGKIKNFATEKNICEDEVAKNKPARQMNKQNDISDQLSNTIIRQKPNVRWDDVAGLHLCKEALKEAVILPMLLPNLFQGERKPWKGILLYGPPGTGKTYLAKACATEMKVGNFFSVSSADLTSKYVGDTQKLIKGLFEMARRQKPSVIFIDQIDSLVGDRSEGSDSAKRAVTEFLVQMDGVGCSTDGVLVLGATNLPWALDQAIRRRFQRRIYVELPNQQARLSLLKNLMQDTPHSITDKQFQKLAKDCQGYSGSDMANLVRDAVFQQLRVACRAAAFKLGPDGNYYPCSPSDPVAKWMQLRQVPKGKLRLNSTNYEDFLQSKLKIKPSVDQSTLGRYAEFTEKTGEKQ